MGVQAAVIMLNRLYGWTAKASVILERHHHGPLPVISCLDKQFVSSVELNMNPPPADMQLPDERPTLPLYKTQLQHHSITEVCVLCIRTKLCMKLRWQGCTPLRQAIASRPHADHLLSELRTPLC